MSFNYGHSLKGYEWIDDKGEVVMYFTFKDLTLHIIEDTTKQELDKFITLLKDQGWENIHCQNYHWNKVEGEFPNIEKEQ